MTTQSFAEGATVPSEDVERFPAVDVKWVPGKSPTLFCYDENESQVFSRDVSDQDGAGIEALLAQNGITTATPKFMPQIVPTPECVAWRQTGNCDPEGDREADADKPCRSVIEHGKSGYCECTGDRRIKFNCIHGSIVCQDECTRKVDDEL
eukprot:CAMPEP_0174312488 /NCGR_PEP_ID=MMETSP0810-20121108/4318_1 /TAXON_ID=73025 ORGANISM="Eutreptiella gymnastica-like, Strain CCMP1594" /NCGR_SAMPLE_ID=MMETSP0810 /ASSEMBLY_ACC=CAM_ASM_000659 /LENGTH=150 /DNA_ID=CAMNT_0015420887 /DNA_START=121 /DNA_END=574 /DNA_ORIENTATION=-